MANVLDQGFVPSATVKAHDALPAEYWDVWVCAAVKVAVPAFKTVTRPLDESTVATVVSLLEYETAPPPMPRELVAATLNDKSGAYVLEMVPLMSVVRVIVVLARFTVMALLSIEELAYWLVAAAVALNVTVPAPTRVIAPVEALMVATLEISVVVEYVMAPAGL